MANMDSENASLSSNFTLKPWFIWILGCLFYFYECLLQVSPSVMSNELMRDFSVTSQTLGLLAGLYFYSYAFLQLPCGVLMDYFGPHRLLTVATAICAFSAIAFGLTENFYLACAARLMIGCGSAFAAVGTMKLAANWFTPQRFALLTGSMVTIGMLGAIGGEAPLALLIDNYGWRHSMVIMGIIGLLLSLLIYFIVQDSPSSPVEKKKASLANQEEQLFGSLLLLVKNKQLWLIAIYGGLMYMATPVFCGLWGVPFLMLKMQISKATAANYISLIFVGWAIASPLWGVFSNHIGLRKPPLYIGSVATLSISLLFIYAPTHTGWMMQLLLFFFGIFSAAFLPAFAIAKELCSKRYVATGLSFMNMMNMIGIALLQPIIGFILDRMWDGQYIDQVRIYPLSAYYFALFLLPLGILVSLLLLPVVKETYCQSTSK